MRKFNKKPFIFLIGIVVLISLALAPQLFSLSPIYSGVAVLCVNIYITAILFSAAIKSDIKLVEGSRTERFVTAILPKKRLGLVLFAFLLFVLVFGFANLYLGLKDGVKNGNLNLGGFFDSIYFSAVTITTIGDGVLVPASNAAKGIVMWELGSGILFFSCGLGVFLMRLSIFK